MIRAVVDPSVFVSALLGRGDAAPARVHAALANGRFQAVVSPTLIGELEDVLARPKFADATSGRVAAFVAGIAAQAQSHHDVATRHRTRDPRDDYLVSLAVDAQVDVIVSLDGDLLDERGPIEVLTPAAFLARVGRAAAVLPRAGARIRGLVVPPRRLRARA